MTDLIWVITSSVLILAVIGVRAILGKKMSAGLRYALWALVLLRLLIPGTFFSSPFSVQSAAERTETVQNFELLHGVSSIEYSEDGTVEGLSWQKPSKTDPSQEQQSGESVKPASQVPVISTVTEQASPERFERMKTTIRVRDILNIVWLVGMGFSLVCFIAANVKFYLQMRERRQMFETDSKRPVYSVKGLTSSCLFLGTIYIADDTAEDPVKLRHIVAHEYAHFRHGDHIWTLLRCAALALHWYNPLVWISALISRQDSELFADAGALKLLGGESRENYGITLIELASSRPINPNMFCAATMLTNGKHELRSRIKNIASRKKASAVAIVVTLLLCAAAASCSFMGGKAAAEKSAPDTVRIAMDLDADGRDEYFVLDAKSLLETGMSVKPRIVNADGETLGELDAISTSHAGYRTYALVSENGRDYVLEYSPQTYSEENEFNYQLIALVNGKPAVVRANTVEFVLSSNRPAPANDNEAILAFVDEVNALFENGTIIVSTDYYNVLYSGMYDPATGESRAENEKPFVWSGKNKRITYREQISWLDRLFSGDSAYDSDAPLSEKLE